MSGRTFTWAPTAGSDDPGLVANWLLTTGGSSEPATTIPGSGDVAVIATAAPLAVVGNTDWPLAGVTVEFSAGAGTVEFSNVSLHGQPQIEALAGATGTLAAIAGSSTLSGVIGAMAAGATLAIIAADASLENNSEIIATAGGTVTISSTGTAGVFANAGGVIALGGTIDITATMANTGGVMVVGGGGAITADTVLPAAGAVDFYDDAGTFVVSATTFEKLRVLGFQAGDVIDIRSLAYASLEPFTVSDGAVTLTDGTHSIALNFPGTGFGDSALQVTNDGSGHVEVTATAVNPSWTGASGDWSTGSLWSGGSVPGPASYAEIQSLGGTFTVTATNQIVGSVLLTAPGGLLDISQSFAASRAIYDVVGTISLAPGANVSAAFFGQITGGATLAMDRSTLTLLGGSPITNNGTTALDIEGEATLASAVLNASTGSALIGWLGSGSLAVTGGSTVTADYSALGYAGASTGVLTLDASNWSDVGTAGSGTPYGGEMVVGGGEISAGGATLAGGSGFLLVTDGATLADRNALIGAGPQAAGFVNLQDGGVWNVATNMLLGGASAALNLAGGGEGGGRLSIGGTLSGHGAINIGGNSTIDAGALAFSGGLLNVAGGDGSVLNIGSSGAGGRAGLVVDAGATASVGSVMLALGGTAAGGTAYVDGLLAITGSTTLSGVPDGSGTVAIGSGATLSIFGGTTFTATMGFAAAGGAVLAVNGPVMGARLAGFVPDVKTANVLDLPGVTYDAAMPLSYDPTTGQLTLGGSDGFHVNAQVTTDTGLLRSEFSTMRDASGGTEILAAPCYAEGTGIATPAGRRPVERLQPGDEVLVLGTDGAWRPRPVRWVGHFSVSLTRHPCPRKAAPIRIRADAFAPGLPERDLLVSPDHAILVGDVLMQAQALANGATVTQEFPARVTYYHIELTSHGILSAEGLAAESYLETGNRGWFAGERGARPLSPDLARTTVPLPQTCAPLVLAGPCLAAAHNALLTRATSLGWQLTEDPDLVLTADGRPVVLRRGEAILPAGTRALRLISRRHVPAWIGLGDDRRVLGVAVRSLTVGGRPAAASGYRSGWHAPEDALRWTDGDARIDLRPRQQPVTLRLQLAGWPGRYWLAPRGQPASHARQG